MLYFKVKKQQQVKNIWEIDTVAVSSRTNDSVLALGVMLACRTSNQWICQA